MKTIFNRERIEIIKSYLNGDKSAISEFSKSKKTCFKAEINNFSVKGEKLYYCKDNNNLLIDEPNNEIVVVNPVQTGVVSESYSQNYIQNMINDYDVHYRDIEFSIGDEVLISTSFDNNTKT